MATGQLSEIIRRLRVTTSRAGPGMTDGQLLECFVGRRDEAAFAALVRRHGPMVWGVCRRILHSHHDAEDAFQATFLVLVRRAGSVVPRQMVANWLYGVARRTAVKARALAARRSRREDQLTEQSEPAAGERSADRDLRSLLDHELARLPDRYRVAIVLCDLEQRTRGEVARQFGVPEGTLSGWLTRGRRMLAKRLSRQGLALSAAALPLALAGQAGSACVPASLVSITTETARLLAAGTAAPGTPRVASLTEGVLKAMLWNKLKPVVTLAVVLLGTLGLIAATGARPPATEPRPVPASPEPPPFTGPKETTEEYYQYLVEMSVVETRPVPRTKKDAAINEDEPIKKRLAEPRMVTREGREASFSLGRELPSPIGRGKGREAEFLQDGLTVRVKVIRSGDDKLEMESTLQWSEVNQTGETEVEIHSTTKRSVREVKLGETVNLGINDGLSGKSYRVRIKVADEEWVRHSTRRRSG
jgi:RNA polymerase sigma factor (sigma-70 family)